MLLICRVSVVFACCWLAASAVRASEPELADSTAHDAGTQAEIERIEDELESARRNVSDLEAELQKARGRVAGASPETSIKAAEAAPAATRIAGGEAAAPAPTAHSEKPAAITRLSPEELALGGVEDLSRLEFLVPGLRYGQTGHDVRLSMRGARTNSIGPEASSVVGVFEDGVYIPTSTARLDSLLDVERIDVLRGPQITNFGQHAYAGAVNVVTNKPNFQGFAGYAEGENSIPDRTAWRLALNIPITDTLAVRIAGLSDGRSGWIGNYTLEPDSDDLNDRKEQTLRSSLLWQPTADFSVLFWRKYQDENGTGTNPWGYQQVGAYLDGELLPGHQFAPAGFIPDLGPWDVFRNFISSSQSEHELNTLDINWDMGIAKLQWLSNYMKFEGAQTYDNDYSDKGAFNNSAFAGWGTEENGWSSELRFSSAGEGPLDWLLGLYWSDRQADWGWLESINGVIARPAWDVTGEFSTETTAVFGQASYAFGDRFTVTGGLRWNEDSKTLRTGEKDSWDEVLWKAALQFDINEELMSYLSLSTGYLAGGTNTAPGVNPGWEPEKLTAYEAGLKSTLASGRVLLNLAAFYNDFEDVQSQSFLTLPFPAPETTEYTGNGGAMSASGVEAELRWLPTPAWKLATNIAYTDAQFGNYSTPNLAGLGEIAGHTQGDLLSYENWHPALSPQWVIGLQTSYTFGIRSWGTLTPYLQNTYASSYFASDLNLAGVRQDDYNITDFRMIWQPTNHFQIQLYYLNQGDTSALNWAQVYSPRARPDIATLQGNWNNPATQGILFNYTF